MGIFSDLQDKLIANKYKKKNPQIEDLVDLTDNQIKQIVEIKGSQRFIKGWNFDFNYEEIKKIVELYRHNKEEHNILMNSWAYLLTAKKFKEMLLKEDVSNLKNAIYSEVIKEFITNGRELVEIDKISQEFIQENNHIFLIGILPDEIKERYYKHKLTDKDILDNLEIFAGLEVFKKYKIEKFIGQEHQDFRTLVSKTGLENLKKVIENYGDKFYKWYNDSKENSKMISKISEEISYQELVNIIYKDEDFYKDLGFLNNSLDAKAITIFGKDNIHNCLKKYFSKEGIKCYRNIIVDKVNDLANQPTDEIELSKALETLCLNILRKEQFHPSYFSSEFISQHQNYFLLDSLPKEIQEKYYIRELTFEDVKNNLGYFRNINISAGFGELRKSLRGVFENKVFLQILDVFNGDLTQFNNSSLESYLDKIFQNNPDIKISSYEEFIQKIEEYFLNNKVGYHEISFLKKLGFNKEYFAKIEENIVKSEILQANNLMDSDIKLFSENIVNKFGFNILKIIIEYRNSGIAELFYKYANDSILSDKLKNWLDYISQYDSMTKKNVAYSIISFSECLPLIEKLISNNIVLNNEQLENLISIFKQKNKYQVTNVNDLTDYVNYKKKYLNSKFQSENILDVKNAILETFFDMDVSKAFTFFEKYRLFNMELYQKYITTSKGITPEIEAAIEIIREILNEKDIYELRKKFEKIIKVENLGISSENLDKALTSIYSEVWNRELFKYDESMSNIQTSFVNGIDSLECSTNINGKKISSADKIQVVELDGSPFEIIVHAFHAESSPDKKMSHIPQKLLANPSYWNQLEGSTTISTSLISNTHIQLWKHPRRIEYDAIYYGFNNLSADVLQGTAICDAATAHGGGRLEAFSHAKNMDTPIGLIGNGEIRYNETVLKRKSQQNNQKFDGRIQPNCIICFNGKINEASKLAAQYFNVPIYMINEIKYDMINTSNKEIYESGNITKFDNDDIRTILLTTIIDGALDNRIKLCLFLSNKALSEGIIKEQEYYDRIKYLKQFTRENGININSELMKQIEEILNSERGVALDEFRRQ